MIRRKKTAKIRREKEKRTMAIETKKLKEQEKRDQAIRRRRLKILKPIVREKFVTEYAAMLKKNINPCEARSTWAEGSTARKWSPVE